jgi:hypothetical protein
MLDADIVSSLAYLNGYLSIKYIVNLGCFSRQPQSSIFIERIYRLFKEQRPEYSLLTGL